MSVENQEYTEHLFGHETPNPNCEWCDVPTTNKSFIDFMFMPVREQLEELNKKN